MMSKEKMYEDIAKLLKQEEFLFMNSDSFVIYTPKEYIQTMFREGQLIQVNVNTVEETILRKDDEFEEVFGITNVAS